LPWRLNHGQSQADRNENTDNLDRLGFQPHGRCMDKVDVGLRMRWGAWIGFTAGLVFVTLSWESAPSIAHTQEGAVANRLPQIRALEKNRPDLGSQQRSASNAKATNNDSDEWSIPARSLDLDLAEEIDGKLVQTLNDGTELTYTVNPALQKKATDILRYYRVEYGTVVAMNPKTGEILAMAEHAEGRPELNGLALQAEGPAASIFKLITAAALVEEGGLNAKSEICTHGGRRGLSLKLLRDNPKRDKTCHTMAQAMGSSNNVAFGRWAVRNLEPSVLETTADRFLFNQRIPFVFGVAMSRANVPVSSELGLAKTAAGFQGTTLSPQILGATSPPKPPATTKRGFLFDGYPRMKDDAPLFDTMLKIESMKVDLILDLEVDVKVLEDRICGRWVHASSGRSYHVTNNPPKVPFKDDETGEPLT